MKRWAIFSVGLWVLAAAAGAGALEELPPGPGAEVVDSPPKAPEVPERIKLNTIFKVTDGERLWEDAYRMAVQPISTLGDPVRFSGMLPNQFEYTKGLRLESYDSGSDAKSMVFVLSAGEAKTVGSRIQLTDVVISIVTEGDSPLAMLAQTGTANEGPGTKKTLQPPRGRTVVRGKSGFFDTEQGLCEATGGVTIQFFDSAAKDLSKPMGVLESSHLRLRMWRNPTLGSTEVGMYVVDEDPAKPGPEIKGELIEKRPDGSTSTMKVKARGMIFENSTLDHLAPQSVDGKTVGVSNVRLRRAIFHTGIQMITEGSSSTSLMPFQQNAGEGEEAKKAAPAPAEPSRTTVLCNGPCVIDFAATPRKVDPENAEQPMIFSQRFLFLNGVRMKTEPLVDPATANKPKPVPAVPSTAPKAGAPAMASLQEGEMTCRHLCLQYPPPPPVTDPQPPPGKQAGMKMPEYAEALGGVHMQGTKAPMPGMPADAPAQPFTADCQRVYYDELTDMLNMEGLPGTPMELVDETGELHAQLCSIVRKTGLISMPLQGKKIMKVKPDALSSIAGPPGSGAAQTVPVPKAPAPEGPVQYLTMTCFGPFTREVKQIIVSPNEPPIIKNILTMERDVEIIHPAMGMEVRAQSVRTVLDKALQPELLDAKKDVKAKMQGMEIEGGHLTVDLAYKPDGTPSKREVHVQGEPGRGEPAYLWQEGTAITSGNVVLDGITNSLWAPEGAVVCVAPAEDPNARPPAPAPAQGAMSGLNFSAGGRMKLQCEGELHYDGPSGVVKAVKNVFIKQEGMQVVTDTLFLSLETAPPDDPAKKSATPSDPKKAPAPKDAAAAGGSGMLSGGLKTLECQGHVEVVTDTQLIQCDHLFYNLPDGRAFLKTVAVEDYVRVYVNQSGNATSLLEVQHRMDYDGKTGMYTPETSMKMTPFKGKKPLPKGVPSASVRTPGGSK